MRSVATREKTVCKTTTKRNPFGAAPHSLLGTVLFEGILQAVHGFLAVGRKTPSSNHRAAATGDQEALGGQESTHGGCCCTLWLCGSARVL